MSSEVEKVVLELSTDSKGTNQGLEEVIARLQKAKAAAKDTAGGFGALQGQWAKLVSAFSVGAVLDRAVGGIVKLAAGVFEYADSIGDLSLKMGVSAEAAQRFRYAARQSGADIEDVTTAIVQMNNHLGTGDASTVSALKSAGLGFDAIRAMKPEDAFRAIADAIGRMPDPMDQTRVAMDLFGKSGAVVLPMIKESSLEAADAIDVLSDRAIQHMKDQKQRLENFWDSVKVKAGEAITWIDDQIAKKDNVDAIVARYKMLGRDMTPREVVINAEDTLPKIASTLQLLTVSAKGSAESIKAADAALAAFNNTNAKGLAHLNKTIAAFDSLEEEYQKFKREQLRGWSDEEQKSLDFSVRLARDTGLITGALKLRIGTTKELIDTLNKQHAAELRPPPPPDTFTALVHSTGLQPGLTVTLGPKPADIAALSTFNRLLSTGIGLAGQFGHSNSLSWRATMQGIQIAQRGLEGYIDALKITNVANRAAAISANLASMAMAGVTLGINLVIEKVIGFFQKLKQYKEERNRLREELEGMGEAFISRNMLSAMQGHTIKRDDYLHYLNDQLAAAKQRVENVSTATGKFTEVLGRLGGIVPTTLRPMLDDLLAFPNLAKDARQALEALRGKDPSQFLAAAAEKFGVLREALGASVNTQLLGASFDEINSFLTMATQAGGNRAQLLSGVSDEMSKLLIEAKKTGAALPSFIKPWVEELAKAHLLLDDLGQPIDPDAFSWTDAVKSTMEQVADYLKEIRDLLAQALPSAAVQAGNAVARLGTGLGSMRHRIGMSVDPNAADRFMASVRADVSGSLERHRAESSARLTTADVPANQQPVVIKQYSGIVPIYVAGKHVADVLMEDIVRNLENNSGNGQPVGPTTRVARALDRVR